MGTSPSGRAHGDPAPHDGRDEVVGSDDAVAVGEGAVLQTVDPGRDTVDDRLERVGVGGDREAVPVRLVDQRHEVVGGELPAVDVGARGQEAAARPSP